ncbi:MAG: cysteine--tRNA ligase [archaeon]|nr:MAG: cysteine--tRNA ligase [archaeon]
MKLYNSLKRKKEEFRPIEDKKVRMYNCGPTVYSYAHIGNLRSFTFADILRRYLEYTGFKVKQVMNITDVGHMTAESLDAESGKDKMEEAARKENKDPWQIAEFYTEAFLEDSERMNFLQPHERPKATEMIEDMIELIRKLIKKGYAYVINNCVYFDISKFRGYGKLSGNTVEKLKHGAGGRVKKNPDKKSQFDFALWIEDSNHIMHWSSPWGEHGYPGWHVECSVMAMKYLGETIDIHTGGEDNKFPHHECEIAQSEGATGRKFCNYWLHVKHLLVDGNKMSKSKGNFYTLRDLIEKGYSPKALRFLYLKAHYRKQMNFTLEGLKEAEDNLASIWDFMDRLEEWNFEYDNNPKLEELMEKARKGFEREMDDDLNTPGALAVIFDFVKSVNKLMDQKKLSNADSDMVYDLITRFDQVLGVLERDREELPDWAKKLIEKREKLRKEKKWKQADKVRDELREKGIVVEDTPQGPRYRYA